MASPLVDNNIMVVEHLISRSWQYECNLGGSGKIISSMIRTFVDDCSESKGDRVLIMDPLHGSEIDCMVGIMLTEDVL
jgi:hypothetical protein